MSISSSICAACTAMSARDDVWRTAFDQARGNAAFAKLLAETAGTTEPALGWFGRSKPGRPR